MDAGTGYSQYSVSAINISNGGHIIMKSVFIATKPVSAEEVKTLRELEARAEEASEDEEHEAYGKLFAEKDRLCKKILAWAQRQPEYEAPDKAHTHPYAITGWVYVAAAKVLRKVADGDEFLTAVADDWGDMCETWAIPILP